jgi:hypothetical protein
LPWPGSIADGEFTVHLTAVVGGDRSFSYFIVEPA